MNAKKTKNESREISQQLRLAISAEFIQAHPDLTVVTGDDLNDLINILNGETVPEFPVDRKRAIVLLARSDNSIETAQLLVAILSNSDETETNRSLAALNLSKMPPEFAEKNLLKYLRDGNPFIRAEILKSLAQIGSNTALEQLNKLTFPGDPNAQQQLSLAKLLISLRSNPAEIGLKSTREALGIHWSDQKLKTIKGKFLKDLINQLGDSNFNISLNASIGLAFDCAGLTHYFLLNSKLKQGQFVTSLRETALIAGIVVAETEEIAHATPRFIVLTFPSDSGIEIIMTRVSGQAIYNGEVKDYDTSTDDLPGKLKGTLRDVGIQRTPTEIEVLISNETITVNSRLWQGINLQKKPGKLFVN